jgi:hypothetical protein
MYKVTPKRGGWIVLRKSDRKQTHKGIFRLKSEATEHMNNLSSEHAVLNPSKHKFVDAFEAFINQRKVIAANPNIALTKKGMSGGEAGESIPDQPTGHVEDCNYTGSHLWLV